MPLITISDLSIRFRGPALLDGIDCIIDNHERIGLLGRNGAGKTTLLKILAGQIEPDHGGVQIAPGSKIALLQQDVPGDLRGTIRQVVLQGIQPAEGADAADLAAATWEADHKVDRILSRMELDGETEVAALSSGMKRRVLLARALADQPDVLLLDEPTNHLDIDAIRWLEEFLLRWPATLIFITHDRAFLRKLATRILEIDGGKLFDWTCDYDTFLRRKEDAIAAQEKQDALFDKRLAEEEVWIRQGIKARRTRNEGRVRRLEAMRRERSQRRSKQGTTKLQIQEGVRSGNLVAQLSDVSFAHDKDGQRLQILDNFSTTIMRGDKLGIIGRNGSGKTTLLKLLLGKLAPQSGKVRLGTNLQIAYFDQLRDQLDETKTVEHDVSDGYQQLQIDGQSRHVLGYLQDFLFTPERARTQIKFLSGGERNRVLLAKLFAKPANVIVLDEPTNDLDAETLDMLEQRLVEYAGTLLMVSHDREFLNNVVTSSIVFETLPDGSRIVEEYVGGYDDWQRQAEQRSASRAIKSSTPSAEAAAKSDTAVSPVVSQPKRKLSFKEQRELDELPNQIVKVEQQIAELHESMGSPDYYKQAGEILARHQQQLEQLEAALARHYTRWEELDAVVQ
ncbi:MAG: ATP-binding cassette domain-containing protein [Pirellulaceae bacterium]